MSKGVNVASKEDQGGSPEHSTFRECRVLGDERCCQMLLVGQERKIED